MNKSAANILNASAQPEYMSSAAPRASNNVRDNYDNDSTTDKEISVQIDLQANKDLEDDDMQFKRHDRTIPKYCETSVSTSTNSENASILLSGSACLLGDNCVANKLNLMP